MNAAVRMAGVTKTFGRMTAVAGLDLEVPRGGLYGFIGPNGAGKTTAIRMLMSILFPDAGTVSILDHASALDAKDRIGYLPEERGLYRKMRVRPFLRYLGRLKGLAGADREPRITAALARVGLSGVDRKRCDELSKGMSQKVQFVAAILHEPDLLILDEPFSGLDPVSMRTLRAVILEEHARGATVLLSTHVMPQAEEICEHIVMVHQGRKVLDDDLAAIRRAHDPRTLRLEPLDAEADTAALASLPVVERLQAADRGYEVRLRHGTDPAAAMRSILDRIAVARIELSRPRLEGCLRRPSRRRLGIGLALLASFSLLGLIDPWLMLYLAIFFVLGFLLLGSLMLAAGAAVNDMNEAASLQAPLIVAVMVPWLVWPAVARSPDSTLALVVSFLPPINTFGMLIRLASTQPPPWWQVWLSIAIGAASVVGAVWIAAKVFRIGLLMYGKPPDLRTLIRWVRAA